MVHSVSSDRVIPAKPTFELPRTLLTTRILTQNRSTNLEKEAKIFDIFNSAASIRREKLNVYVE